MILGATRVFTEFLATFFVGRYEPPGSMESSFSSRVGEGVGWTQYFQPTGLRSSFLAVRLDSSESRASTPAGPSPGVDTGLYGPVRCLNPLSVSLSLCFYRFLSCRSCHPSSISHPRESASFSAKICGNPPVFILPVPRDKSRAPNRLKSMLQKLCVSVFIVF